MIRISWAFRFRSQPDRTRPPFPIFAEGVIRQLYRHAQTTAGSKGCGRVTTITTLSAIVIMLAVAQDAHAQLGPWLVDAGASVSVCDSTSGQKYERKILPTDGPGHAATVQLNEASGGNVASAFTQVDLAAGRHSNQAHAAASDGDRGCADASVASGSETYDHLTFSAPGTSTIRFAFTGSYTFAGVERADNPCPWQSCSGSTYYELFLAGAPELTLGGDAEWVYGGPGLVLVGPSASKSGTADMTFSGTAGVLVDSYVQPMGVGAGGRAVFSSSSLSMEVSFRVILPPGVTCTSASGVFPGCDSPAPPPPPTDCVGSASVVNGTAFVVHNNGIREPIGASTRVCMADVLETDAAAEVSIRFDDGSDFSLGPEVRVTIDEYLYDPGAGSGPTNFSLLRGAFVWAAGLIGGGRNGGDIIERPACCDSTGIRGDATPYLKKDTLDVAVTMNVGSPVSLMAPVPAVGAASETSFEFAFLTPTGKLDVIVGDAVLKTLWAVDYPLNKFQQVTIPLSARPAPAPNVLPTEVSVDDAEMFTNRLFLIPSTEGAALTKLILRFDGPVGSQVLLDSIVFPGLRNGEFDQFDEGWFWEGPGRIDLVATIRADRWEELLQLLDSTPPAITCASPDGLWHNNNVTLACTAQDAGVGLLNDAGASFALVTSVASGDETANASTDSRQVCDTANNCATAGPIAGNKVDRKAPAVSLTSPQANAVYTLGQSVAANYGCQDGGSGIASCLGAVASGNSLSTSNVGSYNFVVNAADNAGNASSAAAGYVVSFGVCPLYDNTKAVNAGATIPIKLQLCDAGGANVSATGIAVTATGLTRVSDDTSGPVADAGNANPDSGFRSDATLPGYIYNFYTKGLAAGTYRVKFKAGADPATHEALFKVR